MRGWKWAIKAFTWRDLEILALVASLTCACLTRPLPLFPNWPRLKPRSSWYASSSICNTTSKNKLPFTRILAVQNQTSRQMRRLTLICAMFPWKEATLHAALSDLDLGDLRRGGGVKPSSSCSWQVFGCGDKHCPAGYVLRVAWLGGLYSFCKCFCMARWFVSAGIHVMPGSRVSQ